VRKNFHFDQNTYHGCAIHNFITAEPLFADNPVVADDELRSLVDRAHQQDLLVIFDIVLNHSGNAFAYQYDPQDQLSISTLGAQASFHSSPQPVQWRDVTDTARLDWPDVANMKPYARRWGGPGFNPGSEFYQHIQQIGAVRAEQSALRTLIFVRYRATERTLQSPDFPQGVVAFSRILTTRRWSWPRIRTSPNPSNSISSSRSYSAPTGTFSTCCQ